MRSFRQSRLIWCLIFLLGLGFFIFVGGCGSDDDDEETSTQPVDRADVARTNAEIAYAGYSDALSTAMDLKDAINTFVSTPNMDTFGDAKDAWLRSREAYQPTELYRLRILPGPIDALKDDGKLGEDGDGPEARINGWPLGEAFIDYVAYDNPGDTSDNVDGDDGPESAESLDEPGAPMDNIIADTNLTIDKETLKGFVEFGDDERNLATGYHAIEFLLWGQDLNENETMWTTDAERDDTPGQRPVSDYYQNDMCTNGPDPADARICTRRATYLQVVTELLVDDLQLLVDAWNPQGNTSGVDNYHQMFVNGPADGSGEDPITKIVSGMGRMGFGELAGERINIAREDDSQEDEHSCFSDNTHRDIFLNVAGIQIMYLGVYDLNQYALDDHQFDDTRSVQGAGIYDLVKEQDSALAENLKTAIQRSLDLAQDMSDLAERGTDRRPFDVQIQGSEKLGVIKDLIVSLTKQTELLDDVVVLLDLQISGDDLRQDTEEDLDNL